MQKWFAVLCLLIFPAIFFAQSTPVSTEKIAVLDLKDWNPGEKNILQLDTKWEFYRNKLLIPEDFKDSAHSFKPDTLLVPSNWNDLKIKGKPTGSYGYATYRLKLVNLPRRELTLDVYSVQTSCRIFINDNLALEVGKPGTTKESTIPMNRDEQINIPPGLNEVQLIVQVANFHHRKGGFVHPFELGTSGAIAKQRMIYYILDFTESSALAIIGLFLFALFIFRKNDLSVLYFSLFCVTLAFRPVISVNYLLSSLFTGINWQLMIKMEYFAVLFPCLFMVLYIKKLFPDQFPNWIAKSLVAVLIIKIAITLFFPPAVFSWLVLPLLFIITIGVVVFAITILRAIFAKVEGAPYAGVGLVILLASLLLKVMAYAGIIAPVHVLITVMDIGFIFSMSLILGSRFSMQFTKTERLQKKTELQRLEIERQKEIVDEKNKSIIDSIKYAQRIQTSLLPTEKYIARNLDNLNGKKKS